MPSTKKEKAPSSEGGGRNNKNNNRKKKPTSSKGSNSRSGKKNNSRNKKTTNKEEGANNNTSKKKSTLGYYANLGKQAKSNNYAKAAMGASAPAMSLRESMNSMALGKPLQQGINVIKISHSGKASNRILTLAEGQSCLFLTHARVNSNLVPSQLPKPTWTPSKGWNGDYLRYLDVADLEDWQFGVLSTQVMEKFFHHNGGSGGGGNNPNDDDKRQNQIVSIFHQDASGKRTLNLLVDRPEHVQLLKIAFDVMKSNYMDKQQWVSREALLLRYVGYDIDKDRNKTISENEFSKLCERLNFYISGVNKHYKEFQKTNQIKKGRELTYTEAWKLLKQLQSASNSFKPSPGEVIWKDVFGKNPAMDSVSVKAVHKKFLQQCQGETDATEADARALIAAINSMEIDEESIPANPQKLTKSRFVEYLRSQWNDAYDPMKQHPVSPPKLNKPISQYWINTSHNTYLMGDQLRSRSSVEAYAEALLRGCKCLELDCWDGYERKGVCHPVIYHGHTLTSKIEFRDVIQVVSQYLHEHRDSYPIILSLENHCSHQYQLVMANTLQELLGNKKMLFIPSTHHRAKELPSPEELKGKAIIKGKRPPEPDDADDENGNDTDGRNDPYGNLFKKYDNGNAGQVAPSSERIESLVPRSTGILNVGNKSNRKRGKKSKSDDEDDDDKDTKLPKYAKELLEITLFHGTKFQNFFEESIDMLPSHMHSIGETKINKIVTKYENNPSLWREYNTDHMTRTYPAGKRIDSSNYNPVLAWAMGCQMVALNFQTHDANLTLNDGRFRQGGNCGYVQKPKSLLRGGEKPNPKRLSIRIISGSCLPKPNGEKTGEAIDPYVKVELHDVRVNNRFREQLYISGKGTKSVDNNGLCPIWNDPGKDFTVENPHVAMVLFQVMDEDVGRDDMIASAAIPVSCLRKGYRSIQVYDHRNTRLGPYMAATLLVHINMKS